MRHHFYLTLLALLLGGSCTQHYFYSPNTLHLPTVRDRGETTAEISLNGSNQIKGFEAKGAYGLGKNLSVMANYMFLQGNFNTNNSFVFPPVPNEEHSGRGFLAEMGLTQHFPIDKYKMFTITYGGGLGRSVNDYDRSRLATLYFNRLFIQPAYVTQGELADFGIGLRFSRLAFYKGIIDYRIEEPDLSQTMKISEKSPFWIPDVGLSAGVNFAPVHLKCNLAVSIYDKLENYSFAGNNLSVSMVVDVHKLYKKKVETKPAKKKKKKKKRRH